MKTVRIAVSAVLLIGMETGFAGADVFDKHGDCSHLLVDERKSPPVTCDDESEPLCVSEKALALSNEVKACGHQALLNAHLSALLWRMGEIKDALRLSTMAIKRIAKVPHRPTASFTLLKVVNNLAFGGLETRVRDLYNKFPSPANAVSLAHLAQRRALDCDFDAAKGLLTEIKGILENNTNHHPVLTEIHTKLAISCHLIGQQRTARRHADTALLIHEGFTEKYGKDRGRFYVVRALASTGRFDEAKAQAEKITDLGQKATAYFIISDALVQFGRHDEARGFIAAVEKTIAKIDDETQKDVRRVGLAYARARAGLDPKFDERAPRKMPLRDQGGIAAVLRPHDFRPSLFVERLI